MSLLALRKVSMHYDGPTLFRDVDVDVGPGAKVGLVGRNGSGKTTLLRILAGALAPTEGERILQRGVRVAYQAQELDCPPGATVMDEMRRVFAEDLRRERRLRELEERMEGAPADQQHRLLQEYGRLQDSHEAARGHEVPNRIASVLSGLGLPEEAWHQPAAAFSGGERNVIALARILLSDPDVILLDEPSNHLDLDGIEWFIRFLRQCSAAVIMVSHDRHLLDATVSGIWELEGGRVTSWTGGYSDFQQQKDEARALQERHYAVQQKLIRRLEFQARRLKDMARAYDDPGQARRAQAMLKRIEQMDLVEPPAGEKRRFRPRLERGERHGRIALQVKGFSFAYGARELFRDAHMEVEHGQRVALVGPNGSGKSTLLRCILEQGSWENPSLRLGRSVRLGQYRQLHEDALDGASGLVEWLQGATGLLYQPATELLHRFLFTREDLDRPVSTLSGGEKSRLQLARLTHDKVNFLLLDEPTNHLDIPSCEQLEEMLEEYDGTLLIISHDRCILERVADTVVEVKDRRLVTWRGTYASWWQQRRAEAAADPKGTLQLLSRRDAAREEREAAREERKADRDRRRELRRLRGRLQKVEQRIEELELRQEELQRLIALAYSPGGDPERAPGHEAELGAARRELEELYAEWERLGDQVRA